MDLGSFAETFGTFFLALNQPFESVVLDSGIYWRADYFIDQFALQIIWFDIGLTVSVSTGH